MIRTLYNYDWFTISLVVIFSGLVFAKQVNPLKFNLYAKLIYSDDYWLNQLKERQLFSVFEIILFFIAHIVLSVVIYFWVDFLGYSFLIASKPILQLAIIFLIICCFSISKHYLQKLINLSFFNSAFFNFYLFYKQVSLIYTLILGFPFLIFYVYNPIEDINFLQVNLMVLSTLYLGFILAFIYKNRAELVGFLYYNILYLCAFEIAPYFFIYKVLDNF